MAILDAIGVSKSFGSVHAVADVGFQVAIGETLGLIGPNGAGKSTLLDVLSGFTRPDAGSVLFDGKDVVGDRPHRLVRRGMARTFQLVEVFEGLTAIESVMIAAHVLHRQHREAQVAAAAALSRVGLGDDSGRAISELSLAHLRLLELARALVLEPKLLLLDEPMSGLTLVERERATAALVGLQSDSVSLMVVEHDMRVIASLCDRVVVLDNGKKIAEGTPQEVSEDEVVITAYLGTSKLSGDKDFGEGERS